MTAERLSATPLFTGSSMRLSSSSENRVGTGVVICCSMQNVETAGSADLSAMSPLSESATTRCLCGRVSARFAADCWVFGRRDRRATGWPRSVGVGWVVEPADGWISTAHVQTRQRLNFCDRKWRLDIGFQRGGGPGLKIARHLPGDHHPGVERAAIGRDC
jgi:hypothetical protein